MNNIIFYNDKDDSTGFNLWQVYNIWHRRITQELNSVGLTHIQFVILSVSQWLNEKEEEVTQVQIAQFAKLDTMMTSTVLRTLEGKNLIIRKNHKKDTRAKCVEVLNEGREKLVEALKIVENVDREFFSILGDDRSIFNKFLVEFKE